MEFGGGSTGFGRGVGTTRGVNLALTRMSSHLTWFGYGNAHYERQLSVSRPNDNKILLFQTYIVEQIIGHRMMGGILQFQVKWRGYPDE